LSFRAAVDTDAVTAAAAHTEGSKVRFARHSLVIVTSSESSIYPPLDTPILLGILSLIYGFWEIGAHGQK
jgi:hypothetical protein